jgi:hypothetical protein
MAETLRSENSPEEQPKNNEAKEYPIIYRCSIKDCGKEWTIPGSNSSKPGEISHGYCPECAQKEMDKIRKMKEKREEREKRE